MGASAQAGEKSGESWGKMQISAATLTYLQRMLDIQRAIIDIMDSCLKELKRANPSVLAASRFLWSAVCFGQALGLLDSAQCERVPMVLPVFAWFF